MGWIYVLDMLVHNNGVWLDDEDAKSNAAKLALV